MLVVLLEGKEADSWDELKSQGDIDNSGKKKHINSQPCAVCYTEKNRKSGRKTYEASSDSAIDELSSIVESLIQQRSIKWKKNNVC